MPFTPNELVEVESLFNPTKATTHDLVVRRGGSAYQREVVVNGKVRLKWRSDGTSYALPLPAGTYTLHFFIRAKKPTDTYGFQLIGPHNEPLGAGTVGPLLVEAYDRTIQIP